MTRANITAAWIAILLAALVKANALHGDYRERATQFEFRVVIEKLQGNDGRVSAISDWRREARFGAEQWEQIATWIAIAGAFAAAASLGTGLYGWIGFFFASVWFAGRAGYQAAQAMGVL